MIHLPKSASICEICGPVVPSVLKTGHWTLDTNPCL